MKVAIIGAAKRTIDLAPFDDPEWEKWVLGNHLDKFPLDKISRIFEIHTKEQIERIFPEGYSKYLIDKNLPLMVGDGFPIEDSRTTKYPLDEIQGLMNGHLTSSLAYMMAYAILQGATHISLYGIEMNIDDNEYFYQRSAIYAWKGFAEAKGIEVKAPHSSLFNDPFYPKWTKGSIKGPYTREGFEKMAALHQEKINEAQNQINQLQKFIDANSGCKQVYKRLATIARATDDGIDVNSIEESTDIRSFYES